MAKLSAVESEQSVPQFVSRQIPLYYQLQTILLEKITSGAWGPGHRLPSEAELGESYGVSRITVRQALAALEAEGRLRREPGRGTFVIGLPSGGPGLEGSLEDFTSFLKSTTNRVTSVGRVQAGVEEAGRLRLPVGSPLTRCCCLRSHRDEACGVMVHELPYELGRHFSKANWREPMAQVLHNKLGIRMVNTRHSVRASLSGVNVARLLDTRIGAPLLTVERIISDERDMPLVRSVTHCRSDIFFLVSDRHDEESCSQTRPAKNHRNGTNGKSR
jgi:GntR family transcriptional regulator